MEIERWAICRMEPSHRADGRCTLLISILFRLASDCRLHPKLHRPHAGEWPMLLYALWKLVTMIGRIRISQFDIWTLSSVADIENRNHKIEWHRAVARWPIKHGRLQISACYPPSKMRNAKSFWCGLGNWESSEERDKYPHFQFCSLNFNVQFSEFSSQHKPYHVVVVIQFLYIFNFATRKHQIEFMQIRFGHGRIAVCRAEAPKKLSHSFVRSFIRFIAVLVHVFMMHYRS